jgi:hypothetical protein
LEGANVKLVPEQFLGDVAIGASGTSNPAGMVVPSIAEADYPAGQRYLRGMVYPAVYRVEVTHPRKSIPPRYNTQSILGVEIAPDMAHGQYAEFDLTSR